MIVFFVVLIVSAILFVAVVRALARGWGYWPPLPREQDRFIVEASRIQQSTLAAEQEMQDLYYQTFAEMMEVTRAARVRRRLEELGQP